MDFTTILGLIAGTLSTVSLLPQLHKAWKSKSARDVSLGMFLILCAGALLWLVYGFLIQAVPVIATNLAIFVLGAAIVALKLKYG